MICAPRRTILLSIVVLLTFIIWSHLFSPTTRAQTSRQLSTQMPNLSDITFVSGFDFVVGIGDFNGDGADDFLVNYPGDGGGEFGGSAVHFKFGVIFGTRDSRFFTLDLALLKSCSKTIPAKKVGELLKKSSGKPCCVNESCPQKKSGELVRPAARFFLLRKSLLTFVFQVQ
jgi:hypothetical protein